jgi:hypothetical protein
MVANDAPPMCSAARIAGSRRERLGILPSGDYAREASELAERGPEAFPD